MKQATLLRFFAIFFALFLLPAIAVADLTVYFLDVGQGDCAFIDCDGDWMIIDGGPSGQSNSSRVYSFAKEHDIKEYDYMIATHPDDDHVGGLAGALNAAPAITIYSPVTEWAQNKAFPDFKDYAKRQEARISIPDTGQTYYIGQRGSFEVLSCDTEASKPNGMSICLRFDYDETSFLFTGDLEGYAAYNLTALNTKLESTVVKVSHHGSADRDALEVLRMANPRYAVISCGKGYGHPNNETLVEISRLQNFEKLFRTDLQGTITCKSDGKRLEFSTERNASDAELFTAPQK